VDRARLVPADAQRGSKLEVIDAVVDPQRPHGQDGYGLRPSLTLDDVGLPGVTADHCPAPLPQRRQATQMRAMRVCEDYVREVGGISTEAPDLFEDPVAIGVPQRIDQREGPAVVEKKAMDLSSLLLTDAMDTWRDFHTRVFIRVARRRCRRYV